MALTGDEYVVRSSYNVDGFDKPFQNVWYFLRETGTGLAGNLATGFKSNVVTALRSMLPDWVDTIMTLAVENLLDLDDYVDDAEPLVGQYVTSDQPSPSAIAAGFQITRGSRRNKRHGSKRIGPVDDVFCNGNIPTTAYESVCVNFANAIQGGFLSLSTQWRLSVPRSTLEIDPSDPTKRVYVIQELIPCGHVAFKGITTQNSRKVVKRS